MPLPYACSHVIPSLEILSVQLSLSKRKVCRVPQRIRQKADLRSDSRAETRAADRRYRRKFLLRPETPCHAPPLRFSPGNRRRASLLGGSEGANAEAE